MSTRRYKSVNLIYGLTFWSCPTSFILFLKRITKKVWKTEVGQTDRRNDWRTERKAIVPSGETGRGLKTCSSIRFCLSSFGHYYGLLCNYKQQPALADSSQWITFVRIETQNHYNIHIFCTYLNTEQKFTFFMTTLFSNEILYINQFGKGNCTIIEQLYKIIKRQNRTFL